MQNKTPNKNRRSSSVAMDTPRTKNRFDTLSVKLRHTLKELDRAVTLADRVIDKPIQHTEAVSTCPQNLDEILFRLRVWRNDISIQRPIVEGKPLLMREWTTSDCLNVLDTRREPVVANLHEVFDRMTTDIMGITHTLGTILAGESTAPASIGQELEKPLSSLWQSISDLEQQIFAIHKQIATATEKEIRRALSESDGLFAEASVLTIDGGGVKSYSSILIITALMKEIRSVSERADEEQEQIMKERRPGDVFEYIIGSSSGGLIAIMLGRLKMTEEECLDNFKKCSDKIFGYHHWRLKALGGLLSPNYSSNRLVQATRDMTRNPNPDDDDMKWKRSLFASPNGICKTGVVSSNCKDGELVPYMFRTYNLSESDSSKADYIRNPGAADTCQIWEAARATSAAPNYFSPVDIGEKRFMDGGFGTNNPSFEAFNEMTQSKLDPLLHPLMISIGSGTGPRRSKSEKSRFQPKLVSTLYSAIDMATGTQRVHEQMSVVARENKFEYFRFNVDEGLEDISLDTWNVRKTEGKRFYKTISHIENQTIKYLSREDVQKNLRRCAQLLMDRINSRCSDPASESSSTFFNVPFSRDRGFVGREEILSRLDEGFSGGNMMALVGIGGVGKSQIAIEYCYRFRGHRSGSWVFWVHAGTRTRFEQGYRAIADLVGIPGRDEKNANIIGMVCEWLRRQSANRWLLVLDNAGDFVAEQISSGEPDLEAGKSHNLSLCRWECVPVAQNGLVLITSRSKTIDGKLVGETPARVLTVEPMLQKEAWTLLHAKLTVGFDANDADKLVQTLNRIPLALTQAAAFINRRAPRASVEKYLQWLLKGVGAGAKLLYQDEEDLRRYSDSANSIGKTWQLDFDYIRGMAPSATRLLSLISLFHPDQIQDYLLVYYNDDEKMGLDNQDESDGQFEEDIGILSDHSLIMMNEQGNLFRIHNLVRLVIRQWLERNGELERWEQKYISIMSKEFPKDPKGNWAKCEALFPHAEEAISYQPSRIEFLEPYVTFLGNASLYAKAAGQYETAEVMNRRALNCCEELLGAKDSLTLTCADNLALVVQEMGKYKLAEDMIRSVYEGRKEYLGEEHVESLTSARLLALVLRLKGKFSESQALSEQILRLCTRVYGAEHPSTWSIKNDLALTYGALGHEEKALELQTSVPESRRENPDTEHLDTLSEIGDLSKTLFALGRRRESEELEMVVVDKLIKSLGCDDPDALSAMTDLALELSSHPKRNETENLKTIEMEQRVAGLGSRNREAETDLRSIYTTIVLGSTYRVIGDDGRAEELFSRALEQWNKISGRDHPDTLSALSKLAESYSSSDREQEAQALRSLYQHGLKSINKVESREQELKTKEVESKVGKI